ncbi:MAG TPA: hypothetical protein VNZ55_10235 [Thermomicrobiales bacterium]|nr:hypothetical protein [Thermomicrobiales bacterium]
MDTESNVDLLGIPEEDMYRLLNEILHDEAAEAAAESGKSVEEELASPGFSAASAITTYAIKLISANNAYLTRQLLDRGALGDE